KVIPQLTPGATTSCISTAILARCLAVLVWRAGPPPGFQQYVYRIGPRIPEIEPNAAVGKLRYRRGDGASGQIPSHRKNYGVARTAKAAVKNQIDAVQSIACGSGISLGDSQTNRLTAFDRRK